MRKALINDKGYNNCELPTERTIGNIMDRVGYNLERVQKANRLKRSMKLMIYLRIPGMRTANLTVI